MGYTVSMYNGQEYIDKQASNLNEAMSMAERYVVNGKNVINKYPLKIWHIAKIVKANRLVTYVYRDFFTGKISYSHEGGGGYMVQCNYSFPMSKSKTVLEARIKACKLPVNTVGIYKTSRTSENGYTKVGVTIYYHGRYEWHDGSTSPIKIVNEKTGRLTNW